MTAPTRRTAGRPRSFDRADALRQAAVLFWRHGFSGTSTRMLSEALGVSSSSLYAAFGSKAGLFDEAVRTYALRYSAIYERAVAEPSLARVLERVLIDSVEEFSRVEQGHPGCLTSSAVMADTSATLDVRTYVADLQRADEALLRTRIEQARADGDLSATIDPIVLTELVQALWQGLSVRSDLGAGRDELLGAARFALVLIASPERS
ncbi:TetR family transcriptional regulator [Kineosporia sp. NBRC 101677]|uniref:TetR/AcrR family transcriptional regulator n=1 Tax=Kineosporia sp. NBRC 101677 TaxID=3032197 RepID=UPI0024A053B7|nr:TetR/AcrR family transcriptional regulator [Kineosporia sp. NBRC 101677]GLY19623.1 TetR family transcriptional regulator [Kineosporia sp. NBRC 101677]